MTPAEVTVLPPLAPPAGLPGEMLLDGPDKRNPWPAPIRASDLCAAPPSIPEEIIRGLMYRGGTMMLSGASKSRKTYTMLALGLAASSGREWLGFDTVACPVLYLNLELQDFAVAQRLRAIAKAMGVEPSADFHILNLRGQMVSIDALETHIKELISSVGAGLVIVDPHYKLSSASGVEENSNDDQARILYRIESAICSAGAAVVLAHHFSKGNQSEKKAMDRAAGGGALARWPDVVMTMTEHEEEGCLTAEFALRNFASVEPFVLRWDRSIWVRDGALNPSALKKSGGRNDEHPASELLARLTDGMSNREWREASGWKDGTYRNKRDELIRTRKVVVRSGCHFVATQEPQESQQ